MQSIFSVLLSHLYHFLHSRKVNDFILTRQINPLLFSHGLFLFILTPSSHFRVGFSASIHSFSIYINSSLFFLKNQCKGRRKVRRNTAEVDEKRFFLHSHAKNHTHSLNPDSAIEKISMNLIQAFSPPNKVRMSDTPTLAGWG